MKTTLTFFAFVGAFAAVINFGEIRRDPDTKGVARGHRSSRVCRVLDLGDCIMKTNRAVSRPDRERQS